MTIRVVTPPAVEPVSIDECKLDARVDGDAEDMLFASWIAAARDEVEKTSRRALINRTLELSLDGWPNAGRIELPYPPLVSVTQVTYYDSAGAQQTWDSSNYIVIADQEPGLVALAANISWPTDLHDWPRVRIRYVAGYGASAVSVPAQYKLDVRGLVKLQYDYRSGWTPDAERAKALILAHAAMDYGW
mgnify:CR=1 FL=1